MRHRPRVLVLGLAVALAAAACGGDDGSATSGGLDPTSSATGDEDGFDLDGEDLDGEDLDGEDGFTMESDEGQLQVGGGERPDWLPPWVLLPEGLDITLAFADETTGESAVTGFVSDADPSELYDDALFMVQSGGYIVGEESQTSGFAFNADHPSDGSLVRFAVIGIDAETVQWSLEFSSPTGDGSTDTAADDEPPAPSGSAVLTITVAGETWTTAGRCDLPQFDFQADDGNSNFSVIRDDEGFGTFAVGVVGRTVDGEVVERWSVGNSMDVVSAEKSADRIFFEGDMAQGDRLEVGLVEVDCG